MSSLYRKYRPKLFSEIIGQKHIVQTLINSIKNKRIGHAYIFSGPRGTGKTTMARLFAKTINCEKRKGSEPCQKCDICKNISSNRSLDIIEIDAASNTGVDNIRELRETVNLPPTQAKYKIYIIDEVHMLSSGAFNALLKTLEEPPSHVIFILATTEIHKIPETILSRCQCFNFNRLSLENIIQKLFSIAKAEEVNIDKEALEMIAISAEGGMRDAESLLTQIISLEDKRITAKEVKEMLGIADHATAELMIDYLLKKDGGNALKLLDDIIKNGNDVEIFVKTLINHIRRLLTLSVNENLIKHFSLELTKEQAEKALFFSKNNSSQEFLNILDNLIEAQRKIKGFFIPQLPLEIAIVNITQHDKNEQEVKEDTSQKTQPKAERFITQKENTVPAPKSPIATTEQVEIKKDSVENNSLTFSINDVKRKWNEIAQIIKPVNHTLAAFLTSCVPDSIDNKIVFIATKYEMHKDKLNEPMNRLTVEDTFDKIFKSRPIAKFIHKKESAKTEASESKTENKQTETISLFDEAMKIMGGKILKE